MVSCRRETSQDQLLYLLTPQLRTPYFDPSGKVLRQVNSRLIHTGVILYDVDTQILRADVFKYRSCAEQDNDDATAAIDGDRIDALDAFFTDAKSDIDHGFQYRCLRVGDANRHLPHSKIRDLVRQIYALGCHRTKGADKTRWAPHAHFGWCNRL